MYGSNKSVKNAQGIFQQENQHHGYNQDQFALNFLINFLHEMEFELVYKQVEFYTLKIRMAKRVKGAVCSVSQLIFIIFKGKGYSN